MNTTDRKCLFKGNLEILPWEEKHIILAYDRSWSIKLPLSVCDVRTLLVFHPLPLSTHCFCPPRQLSPASTQDGARGHFQTGGCTDMPASGHSGNSSDPWRGRSRYTNAPPSSPLKRKDSETWTARTETLVSGSAHGENQTRYFTTVFFLINGVDDSLVAHVFALFF